MHTRTQLTNRVYTPDHPLPKGGYPGDLVVVPPLDLTSVHHILDVGDSEGSLSNIGGNHTQSHPFRRGLKNLANKQTKTLNMVEALTCC